MHATVKREDIKRHWAFNRCDKYLCRAFGHRQVGRFKVRAAYRVENDVGAFARAQFTNSLCDFAKRRVDIVHTVDALVWWCVTSLYGNHQSARLRGQLHCGLSDFAVGTHHRHGLSCLRQTAAAKAFIGRDEGHTN